MKRRLLNLSSIFRKYHNRHSLISISVILLLFTLNYLFFSIEAFSNNSPSKIQSQEERNSFSLIHLSQRSHLDLELEQEITFRGHTGAVSSVEFSRHGFLASGSSDTDIKLWNLRTEEEDYSFTDHTAPITSLSFSTADPLNSYSNSYLLLSGDTDGITNQWDTSTYDLEFSYNYSTRISAVSFNPDNSIYTFVTPTIIRFQERNRVWGYGAANVTDIAYLDDTTLAYSLNSPIIYVKYNINIFPVTLQPGYTLTANLTHNITCLDSHIASNLIASGSTDNSINIWNYKNQTLLRKLNGHTDDIFSISFSPDGLYLASGSKDSSIKIWDVSTGTEILNLSSHTNAINSVDFFQTNQCLLLASGSDDKKVKIWAFAGDQDSDGLSNFQEFIHQTNSNGEDSDYDGLLDGEEVYTYETNPLASDSDWDNLLDGEEVNTYKTNPLMRDTDNDTLDDGIEVIQYKTDPNSPDTDGDLMSDPDEIRWGFDPLNPLSNFLLIILLPGFLIFIAFMTTLFIFKYQRKQKANKAGFNTYYEYAQAQRIGAQSQDEYDAICIGRFNNREEWIIATSKGFSSRHEWQEAITIRASNFEEYSQITSGFFASKDEWLAAKNLGYENKKDYIHAQELKAKNYEEFTAIQKGGFPSRNQWIAAKQANCKTFLEYQNLLNRQKVRITLLNLQEKVPVPLSSISEMVNIPLNQLVPQIKLLCDEENIGSYLEPERLFTRISSPKDSPIIELLSKGGSLPIETLISDFNISGTLLAGHFLREQLSQDFSQLDQGWLYIDNKNQVHWKPRTIQCQICASDEKIHLSSSTLFGRCEKCNREVCDGHYIDLETIDNIACPQCKGPLQLFPIRCQGCGFDIIDPSHENKIANTCSFCGYSLPNLDQRRARFEISVTGSLQPDQEFDKSDTEDQKKVKTKK